MGVEGRASKAAAAGGRNGAQPNGRALDGRERNRRAGRTVTIARTGTAAGCRKQGGVEYGRQQTTVSYCKGTDLVDNGCEQEGRETQAVGWKGTAQVKVTAVQSV